MTSLRNTVTVVALTALLPLTSADVASAQPQPVEDVGPPPPAPRVFHVPTAWLQAPGVAFASSGANHRRGGFLALSAGLGRLAEFDINITDRFLRCQNACDTDEPGTSSAWVATALFKIGADQDALFKGQPAAALGFRKSFFARETATMNARPKIAELYLAISRAVGPFNLHAGVQLWDAKDGAELFSDTKVGKRTRPFAGLAWRPGQYPKTTMLADFSWAPELQTTMGAPNFDLQWLGGWGVRYQALSWGSVELGVRHREGRDLSGATVFVRLNGVTNFRDIARRAAR